MSGAVAFDTLKFAERLESGGFTHAQAKAAAEAFAEATGQELATKADLKSEIAALGSELKTEASAIRGELRELELRMTIKLGALMMAATGVILAAIKFVK